MARFMYIGVIQVAETNLIQSSLSRVRGSKNTTGMGGVKGNTAVAHVTMNNVTAIMAQAPARGKRPRADCNAWVRFGNN